MAVLSNVCIAKAVFTLLGCTTLAVVIFTTVTDGSPFRKELLTPWMVATLVDFYINVVAIAHNTRNGSERKCSSVLIGRISFSILGFVMLATLLYTLLTDGSPFRIELLTPWMVATLIDFYVNVIVISAWVAYKEQIWFSALVWIVLLICFGSITTCTYIVVQLFKFHSEGPLYLVYVESHSKQVRSSASK